MCVCVSGRKSEEEWERLRWRAQANCWTTVPDEKKDVKKRWGKGSESSDCVQIKDTNCNSIGPILPASDLRINAPHLCSVLHIHTGNTVQMEFIYVREGSLILILHVLISDFNPVWSAYVSVSFSCNYYRPNYLLFSMEELLSGQKNSTVYSGFFCFCV